MSEKDARHGDHEKKLVKGQRCLHRHHKVFWQQLTNSGNQIHRNDSFLSLQIFFTGTGHVFFANEHPGCQADKVKRVSIAQLFQNIYEFE